MPSNPDRRRVELTREELYELVWSEAMTKIAARFQISDVALRKRCIKHRIPMPGRGYWRRVETGAVPKRIALPALTNAEPIVFEIQPGDKQEERVSDVDQAFLDYEAAHPIEVRTGRTRPDVITQAVQRDLRGQTPDKYGAIHSRNEDTFQVRVHPSSRDRAIAIVDALAKACRDRGFGLRDGKPADRYYGHAAIVIDDVALWPILDERMRQVPYRMTDEEIARRRRGGYVYTPNYSYEPTGELTLKIEGAFSTGLQTIWKDSRQRKIETRLNDVMVGLRALANHQLEERRKAAERKRRYDIIQEERAQLRQKIAQERTAIERLETDANAWTRAQHMRGYLDAAERRYTERGELEAHSDWLTWARQQADRLDPLTPSPASILDLPEGEYAAFSIWQMPNDD